MVGLCGLRFAIARCKAVCSLGFDDGRKGSLKRLCVGRAEAFGLRQCDKSRQVSGFDRGPQIQMVFARVVGTMAMEIGHFDS